MPRRIAGGQFRSSIPTGPAAQSPSTWVRTNGMSLRVNGPPDGWVTDQDGPAWWIGTDDAYRGPVGPNGPQWDAYGVEFPPRWGRPWRDRVRYGGRPIGYDHLGGRGVLAAVTRATALIVGPVVRTGWEFTSPSGPIPEPLWASDPQLNGSVPGGGGDRPTVPRARRLGPQDFWRTLLTHALWFGAGALLYMPDATGQPLAGTLRVVNPLRWAVTEDGRFVLDPDGETPIESDYDGTFEVGATSWCMRVLRGLPPADGVTPGGVLTRSGLLLLTGERLNSYLASTLVSGVPAGVLKVSTPNFGPADAAELKQKWMSAHGSSRKSVAVLNSTVDFSPLQLSVVDADVVNAKGANLVDIAHAFGLAAAWLDAALGSGGSNITYANLTDRRRDLVDHTLADWGTGMQDFITALLPYGSSMHIDWLSYVTPLAEGTVATTGEVSA